MNRTVSPEYLVEQGWLSTIACKLEKQVAEARNAARRASGELPAIETNLLRLEGDLLRAERGGPNTKRAAENIRGQIADAKVEAKRIESRGEFVELLVGQHTAVREAMAQFEADNFYDWRQMKFD